MKKLELQEFKELNSKGGVIIDARQSEIFPDGFIEGSISIPFDENFIEHVQEIVGSEPKILVVAEQKEIAALVKIVAGSGMDNFTGYLEGGFDTWKDSGGKFDLLITIDPDEFAMDYQFDEFYLVDIRSKEEFANEHAEDAENIALIDLEQIIVELDAQDLYYVYGNTAAEAVTAGSLFKRNGFQRVRAVVADYESIKTVNIPFFVQKKKEGQPPKFHNN